MEWKLVEGRPIWIQLYEQLVYAIVSGRYPCGSRFPSVRELASQAQVNPNTMQRALSQLDAAGLTYTQRTDGRTVTENQTVIEIARRTLAKEEIFRYLNGMKNLGYEKAQAVAMWEEELAHEG